MEINLLSSNVLTSKITSSTQTISNKITAEQLKTDFEAVISSNASLLHQNVDAASVLPFNGYTNSPFFSSSLPVSNVDGTYTVDGVSFTKNEFEQCRSVMQAAVSGIETSGTIDYINYAQMSIATSIIQSFAGAKLNEEQAGVLSDAIKEYTSAVVSAEEKLLSGGGYIYASRGEVSEYYGMQKTYSDLEIKAINDLIDEMNRVSGGNKSHVGSDFTTTTASATNQTLIKDITALFSNADLRNSATVANILTQYKTLMTPIYLANGINNNHGALTRVLNNSTAKLSDMINNMVASENCQNLNISI